MCCSTCLPAEGLLLRPQQNDTESVPSGSGRPESGLLNTSMHDDSSDEELEGGGIAEEQTTSGNPTHIHTYVRTCIHTYMYEYIHLYCEVLGFIYLFIFLCESPLVCSLHM